MRIHRQDLTRGMRIKAPYFVTVDGQRIDLRAQLPDEMIVEHWDYAEGESELVDPAGAVAIDYNVLDYPKYFEVITPHEGDPILDEASDITHELKSPDPACRVYGWDPPWYYRRPDEDHLWVKLTVCVPGWEGSSTLLRDGEVVWDTYEVELLRGGDDDTVVDEAESPLEWNEARKAIEEFRARAGVSDPKVQAALEAINRHRRKLGQRPLDPTAAGWTSEDILLEAQRIRRLNPSRVAALKRKLMR